MQRTLSKVSEELGATYGRLSSGQRINHASDDAASLAVSSNLKADTKVFSQGIRNIADGISFINIATGALQELSSLTIRQQELAEQAANGTYSLEQRRALHTEANALVDEFNRITQSTSFNGVHLFDTSTGSLRIQAGYGDTGGIVVNNNSELRRNIGNNQFSAASSYTSGSQPQGAIAVDVNRDGRSDIITADYAGNSISVLVANSDGTFRAKVSYAVPALTPWGIVNGDVNGDSISDIVVNSYTNSAVSVFIGNSDGSFVAARSYAIQAGTANADDISLADFNGDGNVDVATADSTTGTVSVLLNNGNGTFRLGTQTSVGGTSQPKGLTTGDLNGDGKSDIAVSLWNSSAVQILLGTGNGTFSLGVSISVNAPYGIQADDFNRDGYADLAVTDDGSSRVFIINGNGDGTFKAKVTYTGILSGSNPSRITIADINADGYDDLALANTTGAAASILLANSNGTFNAPTQLGAGNPTYQVAVGDFNGDGVSDIASPAYSGSTANVYLQGTQTTTTTTPLYLLSRQGALAALNTTTRNLSRITQELGNLGASQSRLLIATSNLLSTRESYAAANSRIEDVDVAEESSDLVRKQILQQTSAAILAQANQIPALALTLLRG